MEQTIGAIIALSVLIIFTLGYYFFILNNKYFTYKGEYLGTHHEQTINESVEYGWGTFEDFVREFEKREWERKEKHPESYFGTDKNYYSNMIYAGVVKFDNIGMIFRYKKDFKKYVNWIKDNQLTKAKQSEIKPFNEIISNHDKKF